LNRYDVLGVKTDATLDEIKMAHKKLAAKTHPDVADEVMTPLFLAVQDAYETLVVPAKRAAYDREIGLASAAPPQEPPQPAPPQPTPEQIAEQIARYEATAARQNRLRWLKIGLHTAVLAGLAGYWLFQDYQLWLQVQPPAPAIRLYVAQGAPAVVYAIVWVVGALVASFAEDFLTAVKVPLGCAIVAGAFAFITATGSFAMWIPALATGLALTFAIAVTVRCR
jgi:hypothetical protein